MSRPEQATDAGPLRRERSDLIATAAIAGVVALLVAVAWFSAPVRSVELHRAEAEFVESGLPLAPPNNLTEIFSLPDAALPGVTAPVVSGGLLIASSGDTVTAHSPAGEAVWSYTRGDAPLCSLGAAWDKVVATYRSNVGCGDVVALDASTGEYAGTRSANAPADPVAISSNDRVGTVGAQRLELWRSDMVRTVEYGAVEAKQEPDLQPHEECRITSALTRTELVAVTEVCPEEPSVTWLRFQKATPEDSRAPEITGQVSIPDPDARLVAIAQEAAAVYVPGPAPTMLSFTEDGTETSRRPVAAASARPLGEDVHAAAVADLPHHMTWFDGERLYLFAPTLLGVQHIFEDAIGTGVAVGERLLYPTEAGVAVADWESGAVERVIPVDRGAYAGPVSLSALGTTVVEKRTDALVGLAVS
ncbi:Rv3212 family protein [Corynebacterium guangdongense]|uniref:Secreted protein n=1 Tax=Corynebacterium guangdongense TaxID=1783348 RepID=A0ABU1ZVA3_9CORY|nr:hypothetical protein [Corynebacterium guangdongense]MDR7328715.1 hypothetical protein [Corynebacterium guangdongense]WJZ17292.1 hypothetical protein CGUA_03480 [Corynebacterium guangdongense]